MPPPSSKDGHKSHKGNYFANFLSSSQDGCEFTLFSVLAASLHGLSAEQEKEQRGHNTELLLWHMLHHMSPDMQEFFIASLSLYGVLDFGITSSLYKRFELDEKFDGE